VLARRYAKAGQRGMAWYCALSAVALVSATLGWTWSAVA
jgi:hypothetical protein